MGIVSQMVVRALDHDPPLFRAQDCLNRRQTKHPCTICHDRCPAEALPLNPAVGKIDWGLCVGCGVCVTACPSRCFAPSLRQQQSMGAPAREGTVSFACVHTKETLGERHVECLCALPWEWMAALSMRVRLCLYTGDCASCALEPCRAQLQENLAMLRDFLGAERFGRRVTLTDDPSRLREVSPDGQMDRRGLFGMLGKGFKRTLAAGVSGVLPVPDNDPARDGFAYRKMLAEMVRADCAGRAAQAKEAGEAPSFPTYGMRMPIFGAECFGCGVCVRVCPHQAIAISRESDQASIISVTPWRCTGCGLCQAVCRQGGIVRMESEAVHHLHSQPHARVHHGSCLVCGTAIARDAQEGLCIICSVKKKKGRR